MAFWLYFIRAAISHWGIIAFTSSSIFAMSISVRCCFGCHLSEESAIIDKNCGWMLWCIPRVNFKYYLWFCSYATYCTLDYRYLSIVKDYLNCFSNNNRRKPNLNNRYKYIQYWLLPLRKYIGQLTKNTDITGVKFNISGRPGWKRSNNRKIHKIHDYGNRLTPRHLNPLTLKSYSFYTPRLRGYLKSHIQSSISISKGRNGSVSLKVWISSTLSVDVHELLLHLVRIKELYYQLINRYYLVNKNLFVSQKKWNMSIKEWKKSNKLMKHKLI